MLKQLRTKARSIMIATVFVVVPSFIFFYGWSASKGNQQRDQFENDQSYATFIPPDSTKKVLVEYNDMKFAEWGKRDQIDNLISRSAMQSFMQVMQQQNKSWSDFPAFVGQQLRALGGYDALLTNDDLVIDCLNQFALEQFIAENGISITRKEVMERIGYEMGRVGATDSESFLRYLGNTGVPAPRSNYLAYFTKRVLLDRARQSLSNGAKATLSELWEGYRYENEKIRIHYVALSTYKYTKQATDEQTTASLQAYYDTHIKELEEPAKRVYSIAYLKSGDMRREVTPTPEQLAAQYAANKAKYDLPKRLQLSHVYFALEGVTPAEKTSNTAKTLKQATDLLPQLKTGDFTALANQYTQDPTNKYQDASKKDLFKGGALGFVNVERDSYKFGKEFIDAALQMKVGDVSDPVRVQGYQLDGYSIIKCDGIKEAGDQALKDVEYAVRNDVALQLAQTRFDERVSELSKQVANATTIEGVGSSLDMKVGKTSWTVVASTSLRLEGGETITLSDIDLGFINDMREKRTPLMYSVPRPVQEDQPAPERIAFVLEIAQEKAPMTPPLKEIKSKAEFAYRQDKSRELTLAIAKELMAKATDLDALPTTATELTTDTTLLAMEMATEAMELELSSTTLFVRSDNAVMGSIVPGGKLTDFVNQSMAVVRGDVRMTTATSSWSGTDDPTHYVVWHVTRLEEPSKDDFLKEVPGLRANRVMQMGQSAVEEWLLDRRREFQMVEDEEEK